MTLFTKNPLERLMMQRPYPGKSGFRTVFVVPSNPYNDLPSPVRAKAPER